MRKNLYLVLVVILINLSCSNNSNNNTDNLIISTKNDSNSIITTIKIPEGEIFYQLEQAKNYATKVITKDTISGYYKVYSIVGISSSYLKLDYIIK